mmetsp:Transcript_2790/g.9411  ORF Transcript_2790/g.9411 Transcript_2790/m.9411 type:complete len:234 (-) Transcript_2790:1044-1745(-)
MTSLTFSGLQLKLKNILSSTTSPPSISSPPQPTSLRPFLPTHPRTTLLPTACPTRIQMPFTHSSSTSLRHITWNIHSKSRGTTPLKITSMFKVITLSKTTSKLRFRAPSTRAATMLNRRIPSSRRSRASATGSQFMGPARVLRASLADTSRTPPPTCRAAACRPLCTMQSSTRKGRRLLITCRLGITTWRRSHTTAPAALQVREAKETPAPRARILHSHTLATSSPLNRRRLP